MNSMRMDTELRNVHYLRKGDRMSIKGKQIGRLKNWVNKLEAELADEKQKVKGYEELAKLHSAYIAILLQKLKATEENKVTITKDDITQGMFNLETRAHITEDGIITLYCAEIE